MNAEVKPQGTAVAAALPSTSYITLTIATDVASNDTSITVDSFTPDTIIFAGAEIMIDQNNLFEQYQRKSEGTIGGMPVTSTTLGPITWKPGNQYEIQGAWTDYIKLLPRDFLINEDGSDEPLYFKDATNTGLQVNNAAQEMVATVEIPPGTIATEVKVWGSVTTKVVEVYECNVNANGKGSTIGTGATDGAAITITSTLATDTNYLLIIVKVTATSNRVYGGQVTITGA